MTGAELALARIRKLAAEIRDAQRRLEDLAAEIVSLDPGAGHPSRPVLALIAVDLHSYYTTVEGLLERIIAGLEGDVPSGANAHAELLRLATLPIEGIRPAIVSPERFDALDELRKFRHFFRHAYALELRHDKLRRALDPFAALHAGFGTDLHALLRFLDGLAAELDAGR